MALGRERIANYGSVKILIDMNLSPHWCALFEQKGWEAQHWSNLGDPDSGALMTINPRRMRITLLPLKRN